jgi:hypothetical protein
MNPNCHPIEQQARQNRLEAAYQADGRDNPDHEHHCTYTALSKTEAYQNTPLISTDDKLNANA